jgi:hypothetical protein
MPHLFRVVLIACVVVLPLSVRSDPLVFVPSDALANDMLTSMLANEVLQDASGPAKSPGALGQKPRLLANSIVSVGETRAAEKLAAHYPADRRAEAQRTFAMLLDKYRAEMEPRLGIPRNDLAGSVAAFLAGSYMAYHNVDFPDAHFKPLMTQMRQIIGSTPAFAKAPNGEKLQLHEQMAILGMFMATSQMALKEKPDPQIAANLKRAAKGYLEQFLKTDADRVQITAQGLTLR